MLEYFFIHQIVLLMLKNTADKVWLKIYRVWLKVRAVCLVRVGLDNIVLKCLEVAVSVIGGSQGVEFQYALLASGHLPANPAGWEGLPPHAQPDLPHKL